MRQWLYNHGNECPWNTGGWIKCAVISHVEPIKLSTSTSTDGTASANVAFASDRINYVCNASATVRGSGQLYYRSALSATATFGTKSKLTRDISAYKKLMVSGSNGLTGTFRTGSENSSSTDINTATVIKSSTANDMGLSLASSYPFLVLGNKYVYPSSIIGSNPGNISVNNGCSITEIWLE